MGGPFDSAIAELERQIEEVERKANEKANELRGAINTLCTAAGLPLRYTELNVGVTASTKVTQIQDDTFYGKKQTPAMREYLEMRKAQGLGPAKPRDIFEALKTGGYQFGANETVALVSMRALLRSQPNIFHKLPQGTYGLTAWYPDAKRQKSETESKTRKKKRGGKNRSIGKSKKLEKKKEADHSSRATSDLAAAESDKE
jgi:hypothetical protein